MPHQCIGIAKSTKKRCKNKVSNPNTACRIHENPLDVMLISRKRKDNAQTECPVKLETGPMPLPEDVYLFHLRCSTFEKLKQLLIRGPSEKDGQGYIYMFKINDDVNPDYYKIGHSNDPVRRMIQWENPTAIKNIRCLRRKMAETMLFYLLEHCRMYRCKMEQEKKTYTSFRFDNAKAIADDHFCTYKHKILEDAKPHAVRVEQEWFFENQVYLLNAIHSVTRSINAYFKDEPWEEKYIA